MMMEHRSFVTEMDGPQDSFFVPNEDFPVVAGDYGQEYRTAKEIAQRTPLDRHEREQRWTKNSIYIELLSKENELRERDPAAFKLYRSYERQFTSDSQKLYYLSLSPSERREFLYLLGRGGSAESGKRAPASIDDDMLIVQGMSKEDVVRKWGEPLSVAIAGRPEFQNEKWTYMHEGKISIIYFEHGIVQGWELP